MSYKRRKGKAIVGGRKKDYTFKGIKYKSSLEKKMAMLLDEAGIEFEYEPKTFSIVDDFQFDKDSYERQSNGKGDMINRGQKKIQPIKYTPDFIGEDFIIETKGYANETFPLRWKLFKAFISNNEEFAGITLYKPQKISECELTVKLIKDARERNKD